MAVLSSFSRNRLPQTISSTALAPAAVLAPTAPNAITPRTPGSFQAHRWIPPITKSKPFTVTETIHLEALEKQAAEFAKNSVRAYKAAESIVNSQATMHEAYNGYRGAEAKQELKIQTSNAKFASLMESQRPGYQRLTQGIQAVHIAANEEINMCIAQFG